MIQIDGLVKDFITKNTENNKVVKHAVQGIDIHIAKGEIFGLLGPNGAGKTTTIRMLTMQTRPTAGSIYYAGVSIDEDELAIKRLIGVVPQHINFDADLTVGENMELHARLHHMNREARKKRIAELLEYMELSDAINEKTKRLSGGMKRRLLIARALIHNPQILFLDEPTVALDPQVRRRIWELIRELAAKGVTVLITTHYIEEAEYLCNRVAIMNKGKLVATDTPENFCQRLGQVVVEWDDDTGHRYSFFNTRQEAASFASGIEGSTHIRRSNLEDVFIELTGRKVASENAR